MANREETLCRLLSDGYWEFLRSKGSLLKDEEILKLSVRTLAATRYAFSSVSWNSSLIILHSAFVLSTSLASSREFQRDFIPLVARGLLAWQLLGDNGTHLGVESLVWSSSSCKGASSALGDSNGPGKYNWKSMLRRNIQVVGKSLREASEGFSTEIIATTGFTTILDMLHFAKSLQCGTTMSTDYPISIWKEFCEIGQLDEGIYRRNRYKKKFRGRPALVGCTWIKCPLYGTETLVKDNYLVCTTCKKVPYCGELCEQRWVR